MLSAERATSSLSQELNDNDDDTLYNRIPSELARLFFYYLYAFSIASSTVKQKKRAESVQDDSNTVNESLLDFYI